MVSIDLPVSTKTRGGSVFDRTHACTVHVIGMNGRTDGDRATLESVLSAFKPRISDIPES